MDNINGKIPGMPNIDLKNAPDIKCEKCECIYFKKSMIIKKISKILIAEDEDQYYPIPVLQCAECGHVNKEFEPDL